LEIAKYVVGVGFNFPRAEMDKLDKILKDTEKKLSAFTVSKFKVDKAALKEVLSFAFEMASRQISFNISRFSVDKAALHNALARASSGANVNIGGAAQSYGGGFGIPGLSQAEWRQREKEKRDEWNSKRRVMHEEAAIRREEGNVRREHAREMQELRNSHRGATGPRSTPRGRGHSAGGMSFIGGASAALVPIMALAAGGYGLHALNKRNQAVQSAELTAEAVASSNGLSQGAGAENFEWLKGLARKTGFSYMENAQNYNSFMANSLGMGETTQQSQKMFKGIAEYSRVMHVDKYHQKLIFNAFDRMLGKGKVGSMELTKELGSYLPGAKSIFAQAWQEKTGGKLTGQEAIEALTVAMKAGKVISKDVVPIATRIMEERAAPTIEHASHTPQSEQANMDNSINDLAVIANKSGVEEGFARIFNTISTGLDESGGLVVKLSEGFNEATIEASKLLLFPQSFARALDGRDSQVADWLGAKQTAELQTDWAEISSSLKEIWALGTPNWLPSLKDVAQGMKDGIGVGALISRKARETSSAMGEIYDDHGPLSAGYFGLKTALNMGLTGRAMNKVLDVVPFGRTNPMAGPMGRFANSMSGDIDTFAEYNMEKEGFKGTPEEWRAHNTEGNKNFHLGLMGDDGKVSGGRTIGDITPLTTDAKSSADTWTEGHKGDTQEKASGYTDAANKIRAGGSEALNPNIQTHLEGDKVVTNTFYMEFHLTGGKDEITEWARSHLQNEINKALPYAPIR
jgi:hypothetical protein